MALERLTHFHVMDAHDVARTVDKDSPRIRAIGKALQKTEAQQANLEYHTTWTGKALTGQVLLGRRECLNLPS
jgi:hypothetical protein